MCSIVTGKHGLHMDDYLFQQLERVLAQNAGGGDEMETEEKLDTPTFMAEEKAETPIFVAGDQLERAVAAAVAQSAGSAAAPRGRSRSGSTTGLNYDSIGVIMSMLPWQTVLTVLVRVNKAWLEAARERPHAFGQRILPMTMYEAGGGPRSRLPHRFVHFIYPDVDPDRPFMPPGQQPDVVASLARSIETDGYAIRRLTICEAAEQIRNNINIGRLEELHLFRIHSINNGDWDIAPFSQLQVLSVKSIIAPSAVLTAMFTKESLRELQIKNFSCIDINQVSMNTRNIPTRTNPLKRLHVGGTYWNYDPRLVLLVTRPRILHFEPDATEIRDPDVRFPSVETLIHKQPMHVPFEYVRNQYPNMQRFACRIDRSMLGKDWNEILEFPGLVGLSYKAVDDARRFYDFLLTRKNVPIPHLDLTSTWSRSILQVQSRIADLLRPTVLRVNEFQPSASHPNLRTLITGRIVSKTGLHACCPNLTTLIFEKRMTTEDDVKDCVNALRACRVQPRPRIRIHTFGLFGMQSLRQDFYSTIAELLAREKASWVPAHGEHVFTTFIHDAYDRLSSEEIRKLFPSVNTVIEANEKFESIPVISDGIEYKGAKAFFDTYACMGRSIETIPL